VVCAWSADVGMCVARRALGNEGTAVTALCLLTRHRRRQGTDADAAADAGAASTSMPYCIAAACTGSSGGSIVLLDPRTLATLQVLKPPPTMQRIQAGAVLRTITRLT
jgi:hypothetical protein